MLIKNNNNQAEIIGTWQKETQQEQKKPIQAQESTGVYKSTQEVLNAPRFEKTGVYGEVYTVLGALIVLLLIYLVRVTAKGDKKWK